MMRRHLSIAAVHLGNLSAGLRRLVSLPALVGDGFMALSAKVVSQAVQLAIFIVAAHVLEAAEFGFFAFSSSFAIFVLVMAEGGWGEFVMKAGADKVDLDQLATMSILSGAIATLLGLLAALAAVSWFADGWSAVLILLFSAWYLPASLSTVYDGILISRGQLRGQSLIRIAGEAVGLVVAIGGLWIGQGIAALICGRLAQQITFLGASMVLVRWLPSLRLCRDFALEVLEFSRHIVANRLVVFFRSYAGTLVVGSVLGLAEAGYYRAAERIVAAFSELMGEPARMLAWIVFGRAGGQAKGERDRAAIGSTATTFMTVLMAVSAPVYLGLALVSGGLIDVLLGEKWAPAAILVAILAAKQTLLIPGYVTEPLLSLSGTIHKMPRAIMLNGAISVGLIVLLTPFGAIATALGQCLAAVISFNISMRLQTQQGGLVWSRVLGNCGLVAIAVVAMAATVLLLGRIAEVSALRQISTVALQVVSGACIYVATLALLQRWGGALKPIFAFGRH
ncbi:GumJ protein (plasmid) [Sinorhizobium sp. CCBAU 05631]|nr:GumJ protein [Sinorhizobium sp. CCBAU 05631]PDT43500.1 polysaccharide biosynthesis protein [Sinorhizobium sp. FG01]PDT53047.1 polysaccharide biosynthesis protein [Sinorhizobium sp. NG07B]